jgi:hypothetical protein
MSLRDAAQKITVEFVELDEQHCVANPFSQRALWLYRCFGYTDNDENAPAGFTTVGRNHSPVNI